MSHGKFIRWARASAGLLVLVVGLLAAAPLGAEAVRALPLVDLSQCCVESTEIMHARYFSPNLGRFLSPDPVTDAKKAILRPQMWNKYAYALNNPIANVDRNGRETGSVTNSAEWGLHPGGPLPLTQEAAMWAAVTLVGAVSYAAVGGGAALLPFATSAALSPQGHQAMQAVGEALNPNPGTLGGAADAVGSAAGGARAAAQQALRPDVVLSGGRSGQLVKSLVGPPSSVVRGGGARAFVTNEQGQVILDITAQRVKPVIPGQGFVKGAKRAPTSEELDLLSRLLGGGQ